MITKEGREEKFARVEENPTQKIPRIYLEVRSKYMENLDSNSRIAFHQEFPVDWAIQGSLYKKKYELVPRDPVEMIQFDADESWCKLKLGENIVKGDRQTARESWCLLWMICWMLLLDLKNF